MSENTNKALVYVHKVDKVFGFEKIASKPKNETIQQYKELILEGCDIINGYLKVQGKWCPKCSTFRPLDRFGKGKVCKCCLSAKSTMKATLKNKVTNISASKKGLVWNSSDENYLRDNYKELSDGQLASILKRTYFAVRAKRNKLGLNRNEETVEITEYRFVTRSDIKEITINVENNVLTVYSPNMSKWDPDIEEAFNKANLEKEYTHWLVLTKIIED